jgi:hypothetical protein
MKISKAELLLFFKILCNPFDFLAEHYLVNNNFKKKTHKAHQQIIITKKNRKQINAI